MYRFVFIECIYTLILYFECTYYLILLYACYNKRVFKCEITLILTHQHH